MTRTSAGGRGRSRQAPFGNVAVAADRAMTAIVDRWLAVFNGIMAIYVVLPVLAPLLAVGGWTRPASAIYALYSYTCHQLPSHSWFVAGYQMAYCQRNTAIYLSMLIGGLLYARRRYWTRGLPLWAYIVLSLPIALDGGSALVGLRESTPLLRTITGGLFGISTAWFVYPLLDRVLVQLEAPPGTKLAALEARD